MIVKIHACGFQISSLSRPVYHLHIGSIHIISLIWIFNVDQTVRVNLLI
uniref:Uncharacterized protein n=1 Tax=Arundo donax TaxID=35708 RepID=A0A0A8ZDR6_ARUDO